MLNFSLSGPTCYTFIQYYLTYLKPILTNKDNDDEYKTLTILTNYLSTLTLLQDRPFSSYRTSLIAASCLFYANRLLNPNMIWTTRYIQITSYNEKDLNECLLAIHDIYQKTYQQDKTTSSILRRYLKNKTISNHIKDIIHESSRKFDDENDDTLDLTLDDIDEENMSMEHHR